MPRKSRIDSPGLLHHVMCRGIEKRNVFADADREHFLGRLGEILETTGTTCYAWALIPNHLLLRSGSVPISTVMRRLLTGYALCATEPPAGMAIFPEPLQVYSLP
ncbi:MAG: hypothetical protein PHS17_10830 [Desulfobacterales bacterium]|nr:hypothetical protein [Desulfobacterales bacterium]